MKIVNALFLGLFCLFFALSSPLAQAYNIKGVHTNPAEEISILSDTMMRVVVPPKRSNNKVNVWVTTSTGTTDK